MAKINFSIFNSLKSTSKEKMENAFNIIYEEYSYLVFYVSLKIVKDNDLAKEITNETFTNFFINKNKIDSYKSIKYYLVTCSKNLAINYINKQKRIVELNQDISYELEIKDDFTYYIDKFKDFLDMDEIDLLVLHLLYDFSFKEIAKDKNVSTNVISSKYRRVMQKIKKHYKGE